VFDGAAVPAGRRACARRWDVRKRDLVEALLEDLALVILPLGELPVPVRELDVDERQQVAGTVADARDEWALPTEAAVAALTDQRIPRDDLVEDVLRVVRDLQASGHGHSRDWWGSCRHARLLQDTGDAGFKWRTGRGVMPC
jgi:hypothetical protein